MVTKVDRPCRHGKQVWDGSPPVCAFTEGGAFDGAHNWNCRLMSRVRALVGYDEETQFPVVWSDDRHVGVIPFGGDFAILSYYKERGRTDGFWIIDGGAIRKGTEQDAFDVVAYNLDRTKLACGDTKDIIEDGFNYPKAKTDTY